MTKPRQPDKKRGHGEGSTVKKRADGRWTAAVSLPEGRGRKWVYGATEREARDKRNDLLRDIHAGISVAPERIQLRDYLPQWLEARSPSISLYTRDSYRHAIAHWGRLLGHKRLSSITAMDVQRAEAELLTTLAPSTVRVTHAILHAALAQAVSWGFLARNPMEAVRPPRVPRREMHTLTEDQARRIVAETAADRYHALWILLITSGLRLREALGLRWADVDMEAGRIAVQVKLPRLLSDDPGLLETKNSRARRTISLPAGTVAVLRPLKTRQKAEQLASGASWRGNQLKLVFTTATGAPLYSSIALDCWTKTLRRLGMPHVRLHDLRHTAATLLLQRGVHPKVVQEMLGHSSIAMTMDIYSHVLEPMRSEAAAQMESLF